jgi:hypothetical protein
MKKNENRIVKVAAFFTEDEHAELKIFCAQNKILMKDFLHNAITHCMKKNILPDGRESN